VTQGF